MEAAKKRHRDMFKNPAIVYYEFNQPRRDSRLELSIHLAAVTGGGMFGLGIGELLIIVVIIALVFSRRLPDLGESLGKSVKRFRKGMSEPDEVDISPKNDSRKL